MEKKDLRIIFMGTPEFAAETLRALVENGYNMVAVITQPDKPVGRHHELPQASSVKRYAASMKIPVLQPVKMRDPDFLNELQGYNADLQVVVAFRMLPEAVWSMPRFGTFNVHASLLPQYRGAAPINWAVINGEKQTGITTFFLDHNIDTGRIIMKRTFDIPDDADVEYVYNGLMHLGAKTAMDTIDMIIDRDGNVESVSQTEGLQAETELYPAPKIFRETCRIDWYKTAKQVYDFIRGLSPYPGAWTEMAGSMLKIYKTKKTDRKSTGIPGEVMIERKRLYVNCRDSMLEIVELQQSGKKRMDTASFLNGYHRDNVPRLE